MPKFKDISNQKFGYLTAISRNEELTRAKKKTFWTCQCDCGNIVDIWMGNLSSGHTKSCGCWSSGTNEIGKRYNHLTVIKKMPSQKNKIRWLCKCDCGNEIEVYGQSLRDGKAISCGCKRIIDISGKKYGMLTVLEKAEEQTSNEIIWKCRCDCGTITYSRGSKLRKNEIWSCGCIRSKAERIIIDYLQQHNINYKKEYSFKDLKLKGLLRFDFAIFDTNNKLQFLIEYQGEQHYNDKKEWGAQQREITDKMKIDYCKNNSIILYTISYKNNLLEELNKIFIDFL